MLDGAAYVKERLGEGEAPTRDREGSRCQKCASAKGAVNRNPRAPLTLGLHPRHNRRLIALKAQVYCLPCLFLEYDTFSQLFGYAWDFYKH